MGLPGLRGDVYCQIAAALRDPLKLSRVRGRSWGHSGSNRMHGEDRLMLRVSPTPP
jgi:hypothetical protein